MQIFTAFLSNYDIYKTSNSSHVNECHIAFPFSSSASMHRVNDCLHSLLFFIVLQMNYYNNDEYAKNLNRKRILFCVVTVLRKNFSHYF